MLTAEGNQHTNKKRKTELTDVENIYRMPQKYRVMVLQP